MGNFTKKAIKSANLNQREELVGASKNIPSIFNDLVEYQIINIAAKRGKEEAKV